MNTLAAVGAWFRREPWFLAGAVAGILCEIQFIAANWFRYDPGWIGSTDVFCALVGTAPAALACMVYANRLHAETLVLLSPLPLVGILLNGLLWKWVADLPRWAWGAARWLVPLVTGAIVLWAIAIVRLSRWRISF